jgi:maltose O-acetyltransferase
VTETVSIMAELREVWDALSHPPVLRSKLRRAAGILRAQVALRGCQTGHWVCVEGPVQVRNEGGTIHIGAHSTFFEGMIPTELRCEPGATLSIGDTTHVNYGTKIHAHNEIKIGRHCLFASMVEVSDRSEDKSGPVIIGNDVWIAHGAVIKPGVTIGDGAVIAAGSVVLQDVPARTMALGNPARLMSLALVAPQ